MTNIEIVNLLLKITTFTAFVLLATQIYLNTYEKYLKLSNIVSFLIYAFIFTYPILMVISRYLSLGKIDPFYIYTDVCVLCSGNYEYYINFGRISFYLITVTFFASKFSSINSWFKTNWRKLYVLNYIGFYTLSIYVYHLYTYPNNSNLTVLFWACQFVVLSSIFMKIKKYIFK